MNLPVLGTREEPAEKKEEAEETGEPGPAQEEKKPEPEQKDEMAKGLADIIRDLTGR
jgi:hypothetical protein